MINTKGSKYMAVIVLAVLAVALFSGCAGSKVKQGSIVMNSISTVYDKLPPIYDDLEAAGVDGAVLEAFDLEMNKVILSGFDVLIAMKLGTKTYDDFLAVLDVATGILDRYGVKPELQNVKIQAAIVIIRGLLAEFYPKKESSLNPSRTGEARLRLAASRLYATAVYTTQEIFQ